MQQIHPEQRHVNEPSQASKAQEIERRYRAGESATRIGRSLGLSKYKTLRILRERSVPIRLGTSRSVKPGSSEERQICALWAAAVSAQTIAAELGMCPKTIAKVAAALGLPNEHRRWRRRNATRAVSIWTDAMRAELIEIYGRRSARETARYLSDKYGVTVTRNAVIGMARDLHGGKPEGKAAA